MPGALMLMLASSPVIFSSTHAAVAAPAHQRTGGWETKLNLTDAQKAQIKQIRLSTQKQINGILTPDQQKQKQQARQQHTAAKLSLSNDQKAQIKKIRQDEKSQIEAVLTTSQKQQLQQLRASRQQNHRQQSVTQ